MLGSLKIETDVGFTPTLIPACCNSPELLKEPTTPVRVTIPAFVVPNFTTPVTPELPTCVII